MVIPLRTGLLQWMVGLLCATLGALMLVVPNQFSAPVYATFQSDLPWWGAALLLTGAALLAVTTLAAQGAVPRGVHACVALALLGLALGFARIGSWTGLVFYGALGAATMLAGFRSPSGSQQLAHPRELLDLAAGSAATLIGATLLLVPEQFRAASYDPIRSVLPAFGMAFLASGGLLLIAQARLAERRWLWGAHLAAAATFFGFAVAVPWPQHAWTGVLLYGGTGIAVLLQPWLGPRLGTSRAPSLRTRLAVALCAVATLPLVLAGGLYAQHEETAVTAQVLALHHRVASGLAHDIDGDVGASILAATAVARIPNLLELEPADQAAVLRSVTLVPAPLGLATFDASGRGLARSDDAPLRSLNGLPLYETVRQTGAPAFGLLGDPTQPDPRFAIVAPIRDAQGAMAGFIVLQFANFPDALAEADIRPGARTYLLDPQGRAVVQAGLGALRVADLANSPLVPQPTVGADPMGGRVYDAGGQSWLAGYAPVPSLGWRLVVEEPAAVALADLRAGREVLFGLLLLAALLAATLGTLVARQLAAPLQVLVRAVQELGAETGPVEAAAPLPQTTIPELAQLATTFGAMRATLAVRTTELARLATIVQSSDDAIMSNSLEGTLWSWNPGAERLYGYTATEMIGHSMHRVLALDPSEGHTPLIQRLRESGQVQHRETTQLHKDGHPLALSVTVSPIRDAAGTITGVAAIARDISERRRAEAGLARLAALVQASDDAIIGKTLDGIVTSWNPGAERLYGYTAAEMVGQPLARIVPAELADELPAILARLAQGHTVERYETVRLNKAGQRLDVAVTISPIRDETGVVVGAVAIAHDVTARRFAEEQLRASRQQLEEAAEVAHLGHWVWDLASNQLTWSAEHYRIFGLEPRVGGFEAADGLAQVHPDDRAMVNRAVERASQHGEPWDLEVRVLRPDGSTAVIQSKGARQVDAAGTPARLVGTAQDITERRAAEAALRKSEEQLRQSQKMEGIGLLAGGIAHDFNNLLTAIIGFGELALDSIPADSDLRAMISEVTKSGERAAVLTRQLLAFSRQQVLQPEVVDLNTIVHEMERLLTRVIGEDVDLASIPAPDLGQVFADPGQIEQIIMNLAVNARDAMPTGGKLTIMTANVDVAPEASAGSGLPAGAYVLLAVSDTGIGIDPETMTRIFEPFYTTKEQGKGTGLGLATVYGIVKQSEGEIRVYSEPGQGTTFKIYLPRSDERADPNQLGGTGLDPARGGAETILLVEDEGVVRALATRVLETAGYTVLIATSGDEGLEVVRGFAGRIDLLLTDVVMPGASGVDLARQATALRPTLRVLFMSGYPGEIAVRHGLLEMADAYLGKPFAPHVLSRKVREVLDAGHSEPERAGSTLR